MKEDIIKAYEERDKDWWKWREVMAKAGIENTLTTLGFPTDPQAIYYNQHTGNEDTLEHLTDFAITGKVKEEDRAENLAIELEHWLPKLADPNPVIARSLAMSEEKVKDMVGDHFKVYIERNETKEEFLYDVANMGGSLDDGSYDTRGGKAKVELHDGREFIFSLSDIWDRLKKPRTLTLFS